MQNSLLRNISVEKTFQKSPSIRLIKIKHVLLFLALSIVIAYVLYIGLEKGLSSGWIRLVQMLVFSVMGILRLAKINQNHELKNNGLIGLRFAALLSFLIALLLGIFYFVVSREFLLMALGSACAFLLPHIIFNSWLTFNGIAQIDFGVWNKPISSSREKTYIFFGGTPVKIKFSVKGNDRHKKIFKSHAPLDKSLGEFFNQFVLIQRNNNKLEIDLLDERQEPYGWKFYKIDLLGFKSKQLDPEMDVSESNLKNHSTIMVKRVRLSETDKNGE